MKTKLLSLSALVALLMSPIIAVPAGAASVGPVLPAEQTMYAISCDDGNNNDVLGDTLFTVDTTNGDLTKVGDGTAGVDSGSCAGQAAFDPTNNNLYYIGNDWAGDASNALSRMNVTTGVATRIGVFKLGGVETPISALAISSTGVAYAADSTALYTVNLSTGALTTVGALTGISPNAMSFDTSSNLWIVDGSENLFQVNTSNGSTVSTSTDLQTAGIGWVPGMAYDANGVLWVQDNVNLKAIHPNFPTLAHNFGTITQVEHPSYDYYPGTIVISPADDGSDNEGSSNIKRLSVYFSGESSTLSNIAKAKIRKAIRGLPEGSDVRRVIIRGFVSGFEERPALAKARATAVKSYFSKLGVRARYAVSANAKGQGASPLNRKASITIKFVPATDS